MDETSGREKLAGLIRKHRFAMLTTIENRPDSSLHSRPMTTIERDFDGALWFFAKSDSATVEALRARPQVCVSYSDPHSFEFVCVSGDAAIVTDSRKKEELWKAGVQAWFPEGPASPLNVLIEVIPHHAEYWDSSQSKLVQIFSMAAALVGKTTPRHMGEHRDVPVGGGRT
jgi:general stress protein 26